MLAIGCLQLVQASQQLSCVNMQLEAEHCSLHCHTCNRSDSTTVLQVAVNLAVAEEELQFEHRDLHHGNVLLKPTTEDSLAFNFRCSSCLHCWILLWPPVETLPCIVLQPCLGSLHSLGIMRRSSAAQHSCWSCKSGASQGSHGSQVCQHSATQPWKHLLRSQLGG